MRQTSIITNPKKSSKIYDSVNATLLIKGGFINQEAAGIYTFLHYGKRVLDKIINIVREEMDKIGVEILMSALSPFDNWIKTERINNVDVLFKADAGNEPTRKRSDSAYILQPTHEEMVTPIVKEFVSSYKHLPVAFYQIQPKFRNEPRAKSGLLRGREFLMKDLYSFHKDANQFKQYYAKAREAYIKTFERFGFKYNQDFFVVYASGGTFSDDFSEEFQLRLDVGEDLVFRVPSTNVCYNREVAPSKAVDPEIESEQYEMKEVFGEGIIGVDELVNFLNIDIRKTIKTLIYIVNEEYPIAVAVRGDYEINEDEKLRKVLKATTIRLATEEEVKMHTGCTIGYAGILNLNPNIRLICDESIANLTNFETGANKENYHLINVNWGRDVEKPSEFYDVKVAKDGDLHPSTDERYEVFRASEIGNIFDLGTKFSESFDLTYVDEKGEKHYVHMGCYGIGVSRLMGVIVEKYHDDNGIKWPKSLAPYDIHIITIGDSDDVMDYSKQVYVDLRENGYDVLWDDRLDLSAGEKFADSDLIGIPIRIIISKKTLESGSIEIKNRQINDIYFIERANLIKQVREIYDNLL
ncbi:MAG: proline--tRNA ligase [Candidatus Dojkabacteria bacterium]|nr:proline--tRNA ligase [Candidatus Dojkabacteria bacterium]